MRLRLLTLLILTFCSSNIYAQLNKQQTIDYIFNVYRDAYWQKYNSKPLEIKVNYNTFIVIFTRSTITYSLKDSISCFKMKDIIDGEVYWNIGKRDLNMLPGIRTEDDCKRLYKAALHLQELVKNDKENIDPFGQK